MDSAAVHRRRRRSPKDSGDEWAGSSSEPLSRFREPALHSLLLSILFRLGEDTFSFTLLRLRELQPPFRKGNKMHSVTTINWASEKVQSCLVRRTFWIIWWVSEPEAIAALNELEWGQVTSQWELKEPRQTGGNGNSCRRLHWMAWMLVAHRLNLVPDVLAPVRMGVGGGDKSDWLPSLETGSALQSGGWWRLARGGQSVTGGLSSHIDWSKHLAIVLVLVNEFLLSYRLISVWEKKGLDENYAKQFSSTKWTHV